MSRTDKDRPLEVQRDDPTNDWFVDHNHNSIWGGPLLDCDYGPRNNLEDYRNRSVEGYRGHNCNRGLKVHLAMRRREKPWSDYRRLERRQLRHQARLEARNARYTRGE